MMEDYYDYLQTRSHLGQLYRHFFLYPRLNKRFTGRVLDLGCGVGDFLTYRKKNTVGAEINSRTVRHCQNLGLEAVLIEDNVCPVAEKTFDGVIMDNVLEHIINPGAVLAEVRRVLKQDGCFLVGVPGKKGYASDPDHKVFYDETNLIPMLASHGLRCEEIFYTPFKSAYLNDHLRQYCLYGLFRLE